MGKGEDRSSQSAVIIEEGRRVSYSRVRKSSKSSALIDSTQLGVSLRVPLVRTDLSSLQLANKLQFLLVGNQASSFLLYTNTLHWVSAKSLKPISTLSVITIDAVDDICIILLIPYRLLSLSAQVVGR